MRAQTAASRGLALAFEVPEPKAPPRLARWLAAVLLALVAIAGLAVGLLKLSLDERRAALDEAQRLRLEALASGRADVLAAWLEGLAALGRPLTGSDLVRLFASEMAAQPLGLPMPRWLADQLPYVNQVIADFTARHRLLGTAIVGPDGRAFIASAGAPLLERRVAAGWAGLASDYGRAFGPVRKVAGPEATSMLALDVFLPIPAPQLGGSAEGQAVATLVMTVPVAERLVELLAGRTGSAAGVHARLIQQGPAGPVEVVPGAGGGQLLPLDPDFPVRPGEAYAYGPLELAADAPGALAVGAPVAGLPWTVLLQVEHGAETGFPQAYLRAAGVVAGASGLLLLLVFAALWWCEAARHRRVSLAQAADLLGRLRARDQLFQNVADAIEAPLAVTSPAGRYAYVNAAFAEALGRAPEDVLGQEHAEIFPTVAGDARAQDGAMPAGHLIEAEVAGRRVEFSVASRALLDELARVIGTVHVWRRERAGADPGAVPTDAAWAAGLLERVMELVNPELAARAHRLAGYAVAVAHRLGLGEEDAATLALAARLSPLGRPLTSYGVRCSAAPGGSLAPQVARRGTPLSGAAAPPERVVELLQACGVERTVADLVVRMHQRPEPGGAPADTRPERLEHLARVLRTLDAFCGRIVGGGPEAAPATPVQALYWVVRQRAGFDVRVISALVEVVATQGGDAEPAEATAAGRASVPLPGRDEPARVERAA